MEELYTGMHSLDTLRKRYGSSKGDEMILCSRAVESPHPRFQVNEDCPRDEMLIVGLVEEHIFSITLTPLGSPIFEITSG